MANDIRQNNLVFYVLTPRDSVVLEDLKNLRMTWDDLEWIRRIKMNVSLTHIAHDMTVMLVPFTLIHAFISTTEQSVELPARHHEKVLLEGSSDQLSVFEFIYLVCNDPWCILHQCRWRVDSFCITAQCRKFCFLVFLFCIDDN